MDCAQAQELITALVDDELSGSERAAIEEHLKQCSNCRFARAQELALKTEVQRAGTALKAPAELREKILRDPRVFALQPARRIHPVWNATPYLRPALVLALLVLLALPALYVMRTGDEPLSVSALKTHEKIVRRELPIAISGSPQEINAMLARAVAGTFAPMAFDLSTIDLKTVGGLVEEFDGRKVLVTIYEGGGRTLTCYTLLGEEINEPPGGDIVYDASKKMNFYTYSRGEFHAVLHREGKIICILVSTLPMAELLIIAGSPA